MSYSMSMPIYIDASTTDTSTPPITSSSIVPTSPSSSPSPAPINSSQGTPTTSAGKVATNDDGAVDDDGCTFDSTSFERDASAEVLLKIEVDTVSDDTQFLGSLMDDILIALRDEFGLLCLPTESSRSTSRRLDDASSSSIITGVTLGDTELPSDKSCDVLSISSNTCHVVYSSAVLYAKSQTEAADGAGRVVDALQQRDFAGGDVVDVRVSERDDDDGSVSNGASNGNNELDLNNTASSTAVSNLGLAVGLSFAGAALMATIAVVAWSRCRRTEDADDGPTQKEESEVEEQSDNETNETTALSARQMTTIAIF